jgi:ADP-ribose pyrophosphatase YjhB (NUDIX family)
MCPGVCKDRLADAFERFGRVPIEKRRVLLPPKHPALDIREEPFWSAGGLIHDGRGRVLLVRHSREKGWGDAWLTPGGMLEEGETVLDGLRREVHEEVGLEVTEPRLTIILQQTLTDGVRTRPGYFAQFVARAQATDVQPGADILEAHWFDVLPEGLAFRDDYLADFARFVRSATF